MINLQSSIAVIMLGLMCGCASKKHKDIPYLNSKNPDSGQPTLNVFQPRNKKFSNNPVLLFVHGGNWNSGDKKIYGLLGRNFAKHGITTVVVGYTLSPKTNYDGQAKEIAAAVEWTQKTISNYNGNPNQIFLTGHSAGGHLVALIATNPKYLQDKNSIKGVILNDAAGLDMKHYLEEFPPTDEDDYLATWSSSPQQWQDASPIYFLDKNTPKFMIYMGTKTYESIKVANTRFITALQKYQPEVAPILLKKKHAPMVIQYFFPWNKRPAEIKKFIEENK